MKKKAEVEVNYSRLSTLKIDLIQKFIVVTDTVTGKEMMIRTDMIQKIEEGKLNDRECRVIHFTDGSTEYVDNSLSNICIRLK